MGPQSQATSDEADIGVADFSELMARIYQGPLETPPWAGALELVRRWLQANYVTLILRAAASDRRAPLSVHASEFGPVVPGDGEASYNNYYYSLDPFVGLPADRVVTVDDVFGDTGWLSSEAVQAVPEAAGRALYPRRRPAHGVGRRVPLPRVPQPCVEAVFRARQGDLRAAAAAPETRGGIAFAARYGRGRTLDLCECDQPDADRHDHARRNGTIIDLNSVADEILKQNNGLTIARGTIEATDAQENRTLKRLIRHAVMGHHGTAAATVEAMPITRSFDKPRLGLLVRTVLLSDWSEDNKRRPAVTLFLRDPDRKPQGAQEIIRKLFDLTPAETSLALLLTNGLTLEEAAEESGISKNTARTHLRAIFSKTGVTRQATLVRILLGSVVPLG